MTSPALRVEAITKAFGNHVAVDKVSFEVPRGVVYVILGPNGAGKSTTLRMINDIIAPDSGKVTVLDGLAPGAAAAKHIGYLPEERGLYPKMKVGEVIEFMGETTAGRVVFGPPGSEPLLGVTALESVGILVDPANKTLKRLPAIPLK